MKTAGKEANAEITVFLSLILTCICALMSALLQSARVAGSGWYLQMAADSSLDSLMSKYHRRLWEEYHLLLLEFEDEGGLEKELEPFLREYLEEEPSYRLKNMGIKAASPVRVTDQDGRCLEQEILDYMQLGVWTMERDPGKLKDLADGLKEADGLGDITDRYQADTRKVLALERALEKIGSSLSRQKQHLEAGRRALNNCDGSGFISIANKLKKELEKMPGLIETYEREAETLARELDVSEKLAQEKREDIKDSSWRLVSPELNSCRSYTDREGERRKTVERTGQQAKENLAVVIRAIEEAKETEEYIDNWEGDDEDDELDERPLWQSVLGTLNQFKEDHAFEQPGIKDKKKMGILEGISRLAGGDLLSLTVPADKEVSGSVVSGGDFPSRELGSGVWGTGGDAQGFEGTQDIGISGNPFSGLAGAALVNEYAAYHFTNFLSEQDRHFKYEQEYILNAAEADRENLRLTVNRIVKVREAMNVLYLLQDQEKRNEARLLAAAITGAAGLSALTDVVAFFVLTVWAFAESLEDVRILLRGGKVPFVKTASDWKTSLEQLLQSAGKAEPGAEAPEGRGMDYQDHLKVFLLIQDRREKDYRMMDMIQKNIARDQKGFLMRQCAYRLDTEFRAKGQYVSLRRNASKAY